MQVNGVFYHIARAGAGEPLLLLHGFTGSSVNWNGFVDGFAQEYLVISPDLLGHGKSDSPRDAARYGMECCVADLVAILDALKIVRANVLGYSMGGRVALHLAHAHPERVNALILESASPGIKDAAERTQRVTSDKLLAESIERDGVQKFVEYWSKIPLFSTQARLPESMRVKLKQQRLQNNARGLANSLRGLGAGKQAPLWDQLSRVQMPTLLLAGELDKKFASIAQEMGALLPNADVEIVRDAGHTVHLEQTEEFQERVTKFLKA
jgi:2-succinyl-6-hydroxy-2,4-cyclohexadiene-1-carboxylate synthase